MPTKTTKPASSGVRGKAAGSSGKTVVSPAKSGKGKPAPKRARSKRSPLNSKAIRKDLDLEHFHGLLLTERARLEAEREQVRSNGLDIEGTLPDEGEGGEEDTADLAAAMMDKEMDLSVEDEIEDMLTAVDRAMQKMEDGTYGICDICGNNIPESRLELIPWAALTIECQALSEGE